MAVRKTRTMISRRGMGGEGQEPPTPKRMERVFPDPRQGLSCTQADKLLENGYGNAAEDANAKTVG